MMVRQAHHERVGELVAFLFWIGRQDFPPEADWAAALRCQHTAGGVRNYFSLLFRVLSTPEAHLRAGTDSPGGPAGNPIEVVGSN